MEKEFSIIKKRILQLPEKLNITKQKFFSKSGVPYDNFKGTALRSDLKSDAIEKIFSAYPMINLEWVIAGQGEMLKKEVVKNENIAAEPVSDYKKADNVIMLELIKQNRELTDELCNCREEIGRLRNAIKIKI